MSRAANKTGACGIGTMIWCSPPLLFISGCSNSSSRCLHTLLQEFFLFLKVKEHPADIPLTQDTFRSNLERAIRTIAIEAFAAAYRRWLIQNKMCVCIGGDYVQKS
jgi:hypothetical protein